MNSIKPSRKVKGNRNFHLRPGYQKMMPKSLVIAMACSFALNAQANPVGAQIVNGAAAINQSGKLLTVTNSPNAIINWQGFSIGSGETTRFVQQSASSAVLNRVLGADPSVLLGTLTSNGKVFLINPAGILVGQGARIDVAGFVASTLNLSNSDFLAGKLNFGPTPNAAAIQNNGAITTSEGGTVYLIAPQIENQGIITTPKGETILAAGNTVQLMDTGTPGVTVQVTGTGNNATNLGQILADSGRIGMVGAVVKNSGTMSANSLVSEGGKIFLRATNRVEAGGTITASGTNGGTVEVLGNEVGMMDGATVSVNGAQGGGTVLIGGDYQGKNPNVQNAQVTYVAPTATISAAATDIGNGGKVIVWADDTTRFYGNISARGGANGGNGGFVETSGHNYLDFQGRVDTRAQKGKAGNLLLDPSDITIDNTGPDTFAGGSFSGGWFSGATGNSILTWATINTQLGLGGLEIRTNSAGTGSVGLGDININAGYSLTAPNYLVLLANGNINFAAGAFVNAVGEVDLIAGWNNTGWAVTQGTGYITFNTGSGLNTTGNLNLTAGAALAIIDAQVQSGGNMNAQVGTNLALTAATSYSSLSSIGTQTINFTGSGVAHLMNILGGTTAGVGGAGASIWSSGLQTIDYATTGGSTLGILVAGGSAVNNNQNAYVYVNGVQTATLICAACATWNWAGIHSDGGQTINASTITVNGGSGGNGNHANIENRSTSVAQTITTTGPISLTGGTAPGFWNSLYPNDSVSNEANIHSDGIQIISAGSITLNGGGDINTLGGSFLTGKMGQTITTAGSLSMTGGLSAQAAQYGLGAPAIIGEEFGAPIALNIGGTLTMTGGTGSASPALIGAAQGAPSISITAATISMPGGASLASKLSGIGVLTGGPAGILSMTATTGNISQGAFSMINTSYISAATTAGSINLGGINMAPYASLSSAANITYNTGNPSAASPGATYIVGAYAPSGNIGITGAAGSGDIMLAILAASSTGTITVSAPGNLSLMADSVLNINSGSSISAAGDLLLAAPTINIMGTTSSSLSTQIVASNITVSWGAINAGNNVTAMVAGDFRLNNNSHIWAVNDIILTFTSPTSTLYLDEISGMSPSYILTNALLTTTLNFLGRSSGGVVIDGVETFSTTVGGSGFYSVNLSTPAVLGTGLIVNYSQNLSPIILALTPPPPAPIDLPGQNVAPFTIDASAITLTGTVDPFGGNIGGTSDTFGGDESASSTEGGGKDDKNKGKKDENPGKC